ncbi:hypothetical protein C8Q80DRAFT_1270448 [Daedaleopsis nitida]|nr:hypothetical protein C8Q80DRAFT_1270448 [Daedaleopsis nitida]
MAEAVVESVEPAAPEPEPEPEVKLELEVKTEPMSAYASVPVSPATHQSAPESAPSEPAPASVVASPSPPPAIPVSQPEAVPVAPALPVKPEAEIERKPTPTHPRRRSRSPPTGPRHHGQTPSGRSPVHGVAGPNLPAKPDFPPHRPVAHGGHEPSKPAEASVPEPAPEPVGFQPEIPKYQPPKRDTSELEAEAVARRASRVAYEREYVAVAKATKKAMSELLIADLELKSAEARRAVTSAHLEKARMGILGVDFVADQV